MKIRKKFVAVLVSLTLSLQIIPSALAIPSDELSKNLAGSDPVNLVVKSESNNKVFYTITEPNLKRLKATLAEDSTSVSESNNQLLLSLGYTEEDIASIKQEEIDLILSEAADITVTQSYVKVDADGNTKEVSPQECMRAVEEIKQNEAEQLETASVAARSYSNDGYNREDSNDGYMRITTMASYVHPGASGEKGWYNVSGTFTWLIMPTYRMTDAMSLYADECMWSQNQKDYYSSFTHKAFNYHNNTLSYTNEKTTEDRVLNRDGVYYKWKLPISTNDIAHKNVYNVYYMSFYIRAKVQAKNSISTNNFNVFTHYEHTYSALNIQPSFGWSTGSMPGVSVTGAFAGGNTSYYSLCEVQYNPNRNIYK